MVLIEPDPRLTMGGDRITYAPMCINDCTDMTKRFFLINTQECTDNFAISERDRIQVSILAGKDDFGEIRV